MSVTPETEAEVLETTPTVDWLVPNQDLIERVIDARVSKHAEKEDQGKASRSSRSRSSASNSKDESKS